jgi:hypothetical protein
MPRPVKDDPRDRFKTFRFTEAEVTRLDARAKAAGRTLSDYARSRLLDGDEGQPKKAAPGAAMTSRSEFALRSLAEQMRRVGVNLNQIAHRMNEQRIPPPRELTLVLDEIRTYVRKVLEP